MRKIILHWLMRNVPEGQIWPVWALIPRAVLFPLETFYWHMHKTHDGYDWQRDVWRINGCEFSATALKYMAQAQGKTYKITQVNSVVTLALVQLINPITSKDVTEEMLEMVRNLPNPMWNEHDIYATIVNSWMESSNKI